MTSPLNKKRKLKVARSLTCYLPGLGHLYSGDFSKAILLMFGSVVVTALSFIALALDPPRTVFYLCAWIVIQTSGSIWAYFDVKKVILRTREDYRLKDYNRPWVYGLFFLTCLFGIVPVAVFAAKTFVSNPFAMNSDHSAPTITEGDHVLASKIAYRTSAPQSGDLIIYKDSFPKGKNLVQRVIGAGGDTVKIKDNLIFINGEPENGDYETIQTSPLEDLETVTLSSTELFVVGDNRDTSHDSRHTGPISVFSVTGKVNFRHWPLSKFGPLK